MSPPETLYCPTHSQDDSITVGNPTAPIMVVRGAVEHSKLLPWLMLTTILSGIATGIAVMGAVNDNQNEARSRIELDKQNRFLQEYRIRVEDAEIAAEEVNPKFHPRRTE